VIRIGCVEGVSQEPREEKAMPTVPRQRGTADDEVKDRKAHAAA